MKTEQEQIEKMARTMCGYCSTDGKCAVSKNGREPDVCANVDTQHCLYKEYAERLIDSSYGDISEYKAENERLTKILNSLTFSKKETDIFGKPALLMFAGVKVEEAIKRVTEYNGLKAEIERLKEETSNIRKETAREILDMLYDMGIDKEILECCRIFDVDGVSLAKQICEKYSVEIEK